MEVITTKKKYSGAYKIFKNKIYVGYIDKLENKNEWVCYDINDKPFEICYSKRWCLNKYK